jgi:hypothetical protein
MPDFDQAEFGTNLQYRDHISARLSKQYGGTFAKYVIEMTSAKPKGVPLGYYQFAVKRHLKVAVSIQMPNVMFQTLLRRSALAARVQ